MDGSAEVAAAKLYNNNMDIDGSLGDHLLDNMLQNMEYEDQKGSAAKLNQVDEKNITKAYNITDDYYTIMKDPTTHKNAGKDFFATRNSTDLNVRCDQCQDHEYDPGNDIVMCDNCNCSVHIRCYKIDDSFKNGVPEGDWFCYRC